MVYLVSADCPNSYANFSPAQLSAVDNSCFYQLTSNQARQISDAGACSGFTADQLQTITSCNGLTKACLKSIKDDVFTGMNSGCFKALTSDAISGLVADQVKNIPGECFAQMTKNQMAAISPQACSGFQQEQIAKLDDSRVCAAITSACASEITSFSTINSDCMQGIDASTLAVISGDIWKFIPARSISALNREQLSGLGRDSCSGFTKDQMSELPSDQNICEEISDSCASGWTSTALSGMSYNCMKSLSASALAAIKGDNWKFIPARSIGALSWAQFAGLGRDSCSGFTKDHMSEFSSDQDVCQEISVSCASGWTSTALSGMSYNCMKSLSASALAAIKGDNWVDIPESLMSALTASQVGLLGNNTCYGFTSGQLAKLSDSCSGLSIECFHDIESSRFGALMSSCVEQISSIFFLKFTEEEIYSLSSSGVSGMSAEDFSNVLKYLGRDKVVNTIFSHEKLSLVPGSTITEFHKLWSNGEMQEDPNLSIDMSNLDSLTWLQVSLSGNTSVSYLSGYSLTWDTSKEQFLSGLRYGHCKSIQDISLFSDLNFLSVFSNDFIAAVSPQQIGKVPCSAFQGFYNLAAFSSDTISAITPNQLDGIGSNYYQVILPVCRNGLDQLSEQQRTAILKRSPGLKSRFDACKSVSTRQFSGDEIADCPTSHSGTGSGSQDRKSPSQGGNDGESGVIGGKGGSGSGGEGEGEAGSGSQDKKAPSEGGNNTGVIVGTVIGTIAVLGAVGGFVYWYKKREANLIGNYAPIPNHSV
jgi:hypothetical protein